MTDVERVGGAGRRVPVWIVVVTLTVLVLGGGTFLLLEELRRGRYIHRSFHGSELAGKDLRGVYLWHSDLMGARFYESDLRGASLRRCVLFGTDFSGARLDGVNLTSAAYDETTRWPPGFDPKAHGARLIAARSDCRGVRMTRRQLALRDLRGADLRGAELSEAQLQGTVLRGADLRGAALWKTDFVDADLRGADLRGARISRCSFKRARLAGARLAGAKYDAGTAWPANVHPQQLGAVLAVLE